VFDSGVPLESGESAASVGCDEDRERGAEPNTCGCPRFADIAREYRFAARDGHGYAATTSGAMSEASLCVAGRERRERRRKEMQTENSEAKVAELEIRCCFRLPTRNLWAKEAKISENKENSAIKCDVRQLPHYMPMVAVQ
jgi:hypothetical protein